MSFEEKYLKYKNKYLSLINISQYGGASRPEISLQQLLINKAIEYKSLFESTSGTSDKNKLLERLRLEYQDLQARYLAQQGYPNGVPLPERLRLEYQDFQARYLAQQGYDPNGVPLPAVQSGLVGARAPLPIPPLAEISRQEQELRTELERCMRDKGILIAALQAAGIPIPQMMSMYGALPPGGGEQARAGLAPEAPGSGGGGGGGSQRYRQVLKLSTPYLT
jgi:hypothetical protein